MRNGSACPNCGVKMPFNPCGTSSNGYGPWIANPFSAAWYERLMNSTGSKGAAANTAMSRIDQASAAPALREPSPTRRRRTVRFPPMADIARQSNWQRPAHSTKSWWPLPAGFRK